MSKWAIGCGAAALFFIVVAAILSSYVIGTLNTEQRLRNLIVAKQKDNTSEFDNMWKKISSVAQVTMEQKNALKEIFTSYAQARTGANKGGSLANWIKEAIPNVDTSTFNNLQNIIVSSRDAWTMRQKEILDMNRVHDDIVTTIPSSFICSIFGRGKIEVTIVTSTRTEEAFRTGKDDDTKVFGK